MPEGTPIEPLTTAGFVPFGAAGERAVGEFRCRECGYGVSVRKWLPRCPMCGGGTWEPAVGPRLQAR